MLRNSKKNRKKFNSMIMSSMVRWHRNLLKNLEKINFDDTTEYTEVKLVEITEKYEYYRHIDRLKKNKIERYHTAKLK